MALLASWLPFVVAVLATCALTPPLRAWLERNGLIDAPGARRSHHRPTVRGGGAAMIPAMLLALAVSPGLPAAWPAGVLLIVLALLGWLDDRHDLPVRARLGMQVAVAALMLWLVGGVHAVAVFGQPLTAFWPWTVLAVPAAVWLINLHNFMDGSDGLAAMQGVFSGLVMAALLLPLRPEAAMAGVAMAGACLGFLCFNRPPASIFMGDTGSLTLGGLFAWLALQGASGGGVSIWISFMIVSVFVVDATATLVARVRRGEQWYTAHRQHAYQRLIACDWSHARVLLLYAGINVFVVLPAVGAAIVYPAWDAVLAVGLALVLMVGWKLAPAAAITENDKA